MQYTSIDQITDDMLVERYIALRDKLKADAETWEAKVKDALDPFRLAMDTIGSELQRRLLARGAGTTAGSTEHGTFYLTQSMRLRVAEQATFLNYVFDHRATDLIAASAVKDGVRAYIETHKSAPPGVEVTYVQNLTVRRK